MSTDEGRPPGEGTPGDRGYVLETPESLARTGVAEERNPGRPSGRQESAGRFGSPLTDPRSLLGSATFHALLLAVVSLVALRVSLPVEPAAPAAIRAELGPVDNRVPDRGGGGGPGELGGVGPVDAPRITVDRAPASTAAGSDAALLASLLNPGGSEARPKSDARRELPGPPLSSGSGLVPGPGLGGGGGFGGGSGGGQGPGLGPSTVFFGTAERASSFAYVIDRSGSMSSHNALSLAKRELVASLTRLPPDARFAVILYNLQATPIAGEPRPGGLIPATQAHKEEVRSRLAPIDAEGGTDHARALRAAFAAGPEVIFLLTDGFHMNRELAEQLRQEAGSIRIHVIEFGVGPEPAPSDPVQWLATATGGSYRYVDVLPFVRGGARR
jgi:hypothetical protein